MVSCDMQLSVSVDFDLHSTMGSAYNDIIHIIIIYAGQAIEHSGYNVHQGAEHIMSITTSPYNCPDIILHTGSSIIITSNSIGRIINAMIVTNDSTSVKVLNGRISDHDMNKYESMPHIKCISLSSDSEIATNVRSLMLDRVQQGRKDNIMCNVGTKECCVPGIQTMTRRLGQIGSSYIIDTQTTHGELESRVCQSACRKGLGTKIGLWKKHMHNQLNDRMTKAYRRGVTCTEKVRICLVSCLYPYLLASHLFERELE